MVDECRVERWVLRLRDEILDAIAVFLVGSHLRGDAGPHNPHPPVSSRHGAMLAALAFDVVPSGYRADLPVCLGLASRPATAAEVHAAACRLATGVVDLLVTEAASYARLPPSDLAEQLADGSLRRYVAQLAAGA